MADRRNKNYRVYAYIALARLFAGLDLDLGAPDVLDRVEAARSRPSARVSKEEILHAIRSNSHMTDKVLEHLRTERFATVARDEQGYDIRITPAGVEHLRRFHAFYRQLYARELAQHYRYAPAPRWLGP